MGSGFGFGCAKGDVSETFTLASPILKGAMSLSKYGSRLV